MWSSSQTGKPLRLTKGFDVPGTIDNIEFFAGAARHLEGKATAEYSPGHTSSIRREPIGVVVQSHPGTILCRWRLGRFFRPSLRATRSSSSRPRSRPTSATFAQALSDAGLPPGVVNVLVGTGPEVGAALMRHEGVDMVSFTGSTGDRPHRAGSRGRQHQAGSSQLGGKAPFVVFEDADVDAAVRGRWEPDQLGPLARRPHGPS